MKVNYYSEAKVTKVSDNMDRRLVHTNNLLTAVVDLKNGPALNPEPFHSHPHEQTTCIAEGEILFFVEDQAPVHLKAGDMVAVSSGKKHTFQLLTPTARVIDSFNPVREDFL